MNLQLIFVVESNSKCKSDWIYIKDTIERFYNFDNAHVRLTPVYMDGKGNYKKKQKEVLQWIGQYSATVKDGISKVIYCFDCDDYDVNPEDICFLNNVQQYCKQQNYDFVWFCKDIERVYIGKKVDDSKKKDEATKFKTKKLIKKVDCKKLISRNYKLNTSNIMNVLDTHLCRKES
ncbi:MAG: hypothetical protein UF228_11630 [Lachnospiraceae bacterium]|nr:hypothetical protein [Lachnospiraceae bacterium]